ncbi:MAG: amidohydrolase family protein [Candidatus Ranarchaeia archaeon]
MDSTFDLIIRNAATLKRSGLVDIGIRGGLISSIKERIEDTSNEIIDAQGRLVIPGLVDAHMHLDKAWMGDESKWKCVTLLDMILAMRETINTQGWRKEEIMSRALRAVELCVRKGTTAIRTHVDLNAGTGIEGIKAILDLREQVKPWVDIQIVAFATDGFSNVPDGGESLLRQAMDLGCEVIGGTPKIEQDPGPYLDMLFRVAKEYNSEIDLHIDESNDPNELWIELFAEKAVEYNWEGKVTSSHACSLYWVSEDDAKRVIDKMSKAKMRVITNPPTNLYIRGPNPMHPTGPTRVKALLDAGIEVAIGTDNTRDFFAPLGNADMMFATLLLALQRRLGDRPVVDTVLTMATEKGAEMLGITPCYGVAEGCCADLLVLRANSLEEAVIDLAPRDIVIKRGKVIVKNGELTPLSALTG